MIGKPIWLFAALSALAVLFLAAPATASPPLVSNAGGSAMAQGYSAYTLSFGRQAFAQYGIRVDNKSASTVPQIDPLLLRLAREGHAQNIKAYPDGTAQVLVDEHAAGLLRAGGATLAPVASATKQATQPQASTISGTVTGSGGSPLSGAVVSAVMNGTAFATTTNASGAYVLVVSNAGDYQVGAYADGYEWQPSVTVASASNPTAVNFALVPQNQTIRGNVSSDTGPIAGAQVYAYELAQDNFTAGDSTITDASGNYTLTVSAGTYDVRAFAAPLGIKSRTVQVPPSATGKDFHFTTQTLYRVSGTVRKADGQPLPGAELTFTNDYVAINTCDSPYSQAPTARDDGTYSVLLPRGTYSVYVNWSNQWPDHWVIAASHGLNITGNVSNLDFALPAVATIRGTVRDPNGQPLANAKVFSWRADPDASPWFDGFFSTDASGSYVVTATLGVHNLLAFSDNYVNSSVQSVNLTANRTGVNMQVQAGIQVGGQLSGSDNQPLKWASLSYQTGSPGAQFNRYATVYYNGRWKSVLSAGTYDFYASQPMYFDRSRQVVVSPSSPAANFLLPRKTLRLVGRVITMNRGGLCDTFMTASNVSTDDSTGGSSTGDGDYALMVASGTYNVFPYKYNSDSGLYNTRVTVPPVPTSINFTVTQFTYHDTPIGIKGDGEIATLTLGTITPSYPSSERGSSQQGRK